MGKCSSKCRRCCFSPCRSSKRKRRDENESDGSVTRKLNKKKQQLQELVFATEIEDSPESRVCELETMLNSMKESHAREIKLEKENLEKALSELKASKEKDREKFEREIKQLRMKHKETVKEEIETRGEPSLGENQELESLHAVVEMKKEELQKLQKQISYSCVQSDDVMAIQVQKETLKQRTEDLLMQMEVKNDEIRKYASENQKFRKLLREKDNQVVELEHKIEQLLYRLNEISPTSPSFNPVFITSEDLQERSNKNSNNCNVTNVKEELHFGD